MIPCPWCNSYTLDAATIWIGQEEGYSQPIEPRRCRKCGAEEILIYSIADGWQPTLEELQRGFYEGKNVHWRRLEEVDNYPRKKSRRRHDKKRSNTRNKGYKHQ